MVDEAYAQVSDYRAALSMTGTTDNNADEEIQQDLIASSRYIEQRSARVFARAAAVLIFYGDGSSLIDIDDCVSLTGVKLDRDQDGIYETTLTANDYELWPLNATAGPELQPYTQVHFTLWGSVIALPATIRAQLTGTFGWPTVPLSVSRACIELTAIKRLQSPRSTGRIDEFGNTIDMSGQARNMVDELLQSYRRFPL